jgi:hypothetical protein
MEQRENKIPVLARFPDLDENLHNVGVDQPKGLALLASSSRMIGQAMSFKLLAGLTLFLPIAAVLPFCMSKGSAPLTTPRAAESVAAAKSKSAKKDAAPATNESVAAVASRPPVRVAAAKEPTAPPVALPPSLEAKPEPKAAPVAETPVATSSPWPGAASPAGQPNGGAYPSQVGPTPPMTVRPPEYQADARAGRGPDQTTPNQYDGTTIRH